MKNPLLNALLFGLACFGNFYFIEKPLICLLISTTYFFAQLILFALFDKNSFLICIPLSIYALLLSILPFTLLGYKPITLLALAPMFALTLNSSLTFLNRNLLFSFFTATIFGILIFQTPPPLFFSWGILLVLLILLNRKLIQIRDIYTNPQELKKPITAIFDNHCSFCSREMENLKNRNQTGETIYACPSSEKELSKITTKFSYDEAMKTIHALDADGNVITGTKTISAVFARAGLPWLAITLQAPGFDYFFKFGYLIFTKLRKRSSC